MGKKVIMPKSKEEYPEAKIYKINKTKKHHDKQH